MKIQWRKKQLQKRLHQQQSYVPVDNLLRENNKSFSVSINQKRSNPFIK